MSATNLQALLRLLSQNAKVPLATAMSKVKELQAADLDSAEKISKVKVDALNPIFNDDKICKQVLAAAKRSAKKRAAGDDAGAAPSPKKKAKKGDLLFAADADAAAAASPEELEAALELPSSDADEAELEQTVLFTNRAPLALAFVFTLLKYSMPTQPLSSRLSLAQGYISITSRARAVYLGIESGKSAEEEGFGEGTPSVFITGKEIKVLRRWGYVWKRAGDQLPVDGSSAAEKNSEVPDEGDEPQVGEDEQPALWALDLEALKKSNNHAPIVSSASHRSTANAALPIYTPQSARSYLLRAFDTAPPSTDTQKKRSAAARNAEKESNLGRLLRALDLLYQSWATILPPEDLDKRTWGWYVKVRPDVADGVAGWGGKNSLRLADILALRRQG
ncbi:hypothetical protein BDY17DRAFT_244234 [Neohortaea acidophila]|uniref:Impact N-terminal domain-containing protein n=1 Tax=Neohortaea acidophila TaxID=245834 RepID=A0A6A6Q766_9PEZI|nr:uncharacterized protein BDY17DRAFT_244234 [Neohortaea acidophila]KAF2487921.1 hypothetical protein BDY17DRAFT_244234 [Neohortaea acidophila]